MEKHQNSMELPNDIERQVKLALEEDIGGGDVTAALIPADNAASASVLCREEAILCGTAWFNQVFKQIDTTVKIEWLYEDGYVIPAGSTLCRLNGKARSLLSGERAALNFLQTLSATATLTQRYVKQIEGTKAQILDTRKTLPTLRKAQKYAVLCGGGRNHRIGLFDMILIKENHIMAAGSISQAVAQAKSLYPDIKVEVETENMDEFREAGKAMADIIMLDNFDLETMRRAVEENDGKITLEASGGVNLDTVRAIAETGVDYISVGEITKNIDAVDLSMRFAQTSR